MAFLLIAHATKPHYDIRHIAPKADWRPHARTVDALINSDQGSVRQEVHDRDHRLGPRDAARRVSEVGRTLQNLAQQDKRCARSSVSFSVNPGDSTIDKGGEAATAMTRPAAPRSRNHPKSLMPKLGVHPRVATAVAQALRLAGHAIEQFARISDSAPLHQGHVVIQLQNQQRQRRNGGQGLLGLQLRLLRQANLARLRQPMGRRRHRNPLVYRKLSSAHPGTHPIPAALVSPTRFSW